VLIVQIYASCQGSWADDLRDCNSPKESHLRNFWSTSFARAVCTKSPVATSKHVIANFQHIWFLLIWPLATANRLDHGGWARNCGRLGYVRRKRLMCRRNILIAPIPWKTPWKMSNCCRMLLWVFQRSMQPFLDSWMQIELDLRFCFWGCVAVSRIAQSEWDRGSSKCMNWTQQSWS